MQVPTSWRVPLRALRYRDYRLYFVGQLCSLCGTWMQSVALSWLVYRLTGSTTLLGLVAFASQAPFIPLAYAGGLVADRFRRRHILLVTQSAAMALALMMALLTLTGYIRVWHIFTLAISLGVVNAFDVPARQCFLVDLVGKDDLLNALALNSILFNTARVIAPTLAGILISRVGEGWCFVGNTASFGAVIIALLLMTSPSSRAAKPESTTLTTLGEGLRFAYRANLVRALLLLTAIASLVGLPYTVFLPVFANQFLKGGSPSLGLLVSAAGVGAFAGALLLTTRQKVQKPERWVTLAVIGFGSGLILLSLSRSLGLSLGVLSLIGLSSMAQITLSNTIIQGLVPDRLRGRVMALYSASFIGIVPFGVMLVGILAEHYGLRGMLGAGGAICLGAGILFGLRSRALKDKSIQLMTKFEATEAV